MEFKTATQEADQKAEVEREIKRLERAAMDAHVEAQALNKQQRYEGTWGAPAQTERAPLTRVDVSNLTFPHVATKRLFGSLRVAAQQDRVACVARR